MAGKRGLGKFFGGWLAGLFKDSWTITQLEETIKFYEQDVRDANKWIAKYENDIIRFAHVPFMVKNIKGMIEIELKGRKASEDALIYYRAKLEQMKHDKS